MAIIARSPTRVDLAGGTLDIEPMTRILQNKMTLNFGITLDAEVRLQKASSSQYLIKSQDQSLELKGSWSEVTQGGKLPLFEKLIANFWSQALPPIEVEVRAKSPAGAGLGGSSCLAVAFASALLQARKELGVPVYLNDNQFIKTVQDVETGVINVPTGCQDYWGGFRGGINLISYPNGQTIVETLRGQQAKPLEELLILCYSGVSRASGTNNWAIFQKAFEGHKPTLAILNEIGALAEQACNAVKQGAWQDVFRLSAAEWKLRVQLWSDIETTETKRIAEAALSKGALFSRICGAGGGGVMAVFAEPSKRSAVCQALEAAGGKVLEGTVSYEGTTVKGSWHD